VERTIRVEHDLAWLPRPNECHLVLSTSLPPAELISSVFALAFAGDRLLLTRLASRGWDIPGGHICAGESLEDALRREVYEEAGARLGRFGPLGYAMFRLLTPPPPGYRYPCPDSYLVIYWAEVAVLDAFVPTAEARDRRLFTPATARRVRYVQRHPELYAAALAATQVSGTAQ
jgi:8-oxo-dGTP diphosphatase